MSPLRAVCIWGSESSTAKHGITKHAKDWPLSAQLPTRSQLRATAQERESRERSSVEKEL